MRSGRGETQLRRDHGAACASTCVGRSRRTPHIALGSRHHVASPQLRHSQNIQKNHMHTHHTHTHTFQSRHTPNMDSEEATNPPASCPQVICPTCRTNMTIQPASRKAKHSSAHVASSSASSSVQYICARRRRVLHHWYAHLQLTVALTVALVCLMVGL